MRGHGKEAVKAVMADEDILDLELLMAELEVARRIRDA